MGVFSDLKSRFGFAPAENGDGEAEIGQAPEGDFAEDDGFAGDNRGAGVPFDGRDDAPWSDPLAGVPEMPAALEAGEPGGNVPLISRNDVRQYLRGLDRSRNADPRKPVGRMVDVPAGPAQRQIVPNDYAPVRGVAGIPASVPPAFEPSLPVWPDPDRPMEDAAPAAPATAAPQAAAVPVAVDAPAGHPGYGQSAFLGPKAEDAPTAPAALSAQEPQAPQPQAPQPEYRAFPGSAQTYRSMNAADDFIPRTPAATAPVSGGFYREPASQVPATPAPWPGAVPVSPEQMAAPAAPRYVPPAQAAPQYAPVAPAPAASTAAQADHAALYASDAVTQLPGAQVREIVVVNPGSFEDAEMISAGLRARKAVVVNVRQVPDFLSRRIMDFAFGAASASGATVGVIANKMYALTFNRALNEYEILSLRNRGAL